MIKTRPMMTLPLKESAGTSEPDNPREHAVIKTVPSPVAAFRLSMTLVIIVALLSYALSSHAEPEADQATIKRFFEKRFPDVALADYPNGVHALDENAREQWEAIEEFPPYELAIDAGKELFETPFANGKSYADCFPDV